MSNLMQIEVEALKKTKPPGVLKAPIEDLPELAEIGCKSYLEYHFHWQSTGGGSWWIDGNLQGDFKYECFQCGGELIQEFKIPLKILVNSGAVEGENWSDDDDMGIDEYLVTLGPDALNISILSQVREQIVLNCNPAFPNTDKNGGKCQNCEKEGNFNYNSTVQKEIDPRWAALKALKDQKKNQE